MKYHSHERHCCDLNIHMFVDGVEAGATGWIAPDAIATVDLGPVTPGIHTVGLRAEGPITLSCWSGDGEVYTSVTSVPVSVDIKPGSYPNCLNINGHGVIPVAILGSANFDVTQVDPSTLQFGGLDVRVRGKNGTPQCSIEDVSGDFSSPEGLPDEYDHLVCQFVDDSATWSPDTGTASLTGELFDHTPIEGSDSICMVP